MSRISFERDGRGEIVGAWVDDQAGPRLPAAKNGPGPIRIIATAIGSLLDRLTLTSKRLAALEDRIAELDQGPASHEAKKLAFDKLAAERGREGKPFNLKLEAS